MVEQYFNVGQPLVYAYNRIASIKLTGIISLDKNLVN